MEDLKINVLVPNKDFTDSAYKYIKVNTEGPTLNDEEIYFKASLPSHVHNYLANTENYPDLKKTIKINSFKALKTLISNYCEECLKIEESKHLNKEKLLFIRFNSQKSITRDEWCGASTGNKITTNFQFFVGYKTIEKRRRDFASDELEDLVKYYSEYVHRTSMSVGAYKLGTLQPLNMDWKHREVENTFTIIPYTDKRFEFLLDLEETFNKLSINLNEFLSDLDKEKLDLIIENNVKFLE